MANGSIGILEHSERRIVYVQELVDLARVACALERHRLALGEFPETLDALSPRFIGTIPHDIIGGQPLHYRRADNGSYVLYSVGWNGKDDGGAFEKEAEDRELDLGNGDWVWQSPTKGFSGMISKVESFQICVHLWPTPAMCHVPFTFPRFAVKTPASSTMLPSGSTSTRRAGSFFLPALLCRSRFDGGSPTDQTMLQPFQRW